MITNGLQKLLLTLIYQDEDSFNQPQTQNLTKLIPAYPTATFANFFIAKAGFDLSVQLPIAKDFAMI